MRRPLCTRDTEEKFRSASLRFCQQHLLPGMLAEPFYMAGLDVVDSADDLDLARLNAIPSDRTVREQILDRTPHVRLGDCRHKIHAMKIGMRCLGFGQSRSNAGYQRLDVAMYFGMRGCCFHRAASCMAQYDQQRRSYMIDAVFDRTHLALAAYVAGNSNHEDIAYSLIEENFQRHS